MFQHADLHPNFISVDVISLIVTSEFNPPEDKTLSAAECTEKAQKYVAYKSVIQPL